MLYCLVYVATELVRIVFAGVYAISWLPIIFVTALLLAGGVLYSASLVFLFGRFVFGALWQSVRFALPKLRFQLIELFALLLILQLAYSLTQAIWPIIEDSYCALLIVTQGIETQFSFAFSSSTADDADRIIFSAVCCGVALFCWALGLALNQSNQIQQTFDRLTMLLLLAPFGTMCIVLFPTITVYFLAKLVTHGDPLRLVDSLLWHGVVLVGGSLLGVLYCRAIASWLVRRAESAAATKKVAKLEGA